MNLLSILYLSIFSRFSFREIIISYENMYQQFFVQAKSAIAYLSSDELQELINDDEKLEGRVNSVVIL